MYEIIKEKIKCYNGVEREFRYRKDTSDLNTIRSICLFDEYETQKLPIKDGDVIIDIGAHIGAFPVLLSALKQHLGIYCYEPIPENYNLLFQNLQYNDLQNFGFCYQLAVTAQNRPKARIYYGNDTKDGEVHKFIGTPHFGAKNDDEGHFVDADTISLTDIFILNDISRVKLLKIDAEGFEWEVFADTPLEVLSCIDFIVGEIHALPGTQNCQSLDDLLQVTKNLYKPIIFPPGQGGIQEFCLKLKTL